MNFGDRWYEPREDGFISTDSLLEDNPYAAVNDPWVLSAYTYASVEPDAIRRPGRPCTKDGMERL